MQRREAAELAGRAKEAFERLGAQAQEDRVRLAAWWPGDSVEPS